ncbi:hypothetical protein SCA03_30340 [Streptomyces cacaoi]|uniref:Uncharacterized protein n=1 Tax=Streptomyces cacaoi TaxID=1898 RepID=A0A4Y3R137_STRCI|nr:hypothetical protein SCA03_30340 [Streptomyces cacaoi]
MREWARPPVAAPARAVRRGARWAARAGAAGVNFPVNEAGWAPGYGRCRRHGRGGVREARPRPADAGARAAADGRRCPAEQGTDVLREKGASRAFRAG